MRSLMRGLVIKIGLVVLSSIFLASACASLGDLTEEVMKARESGKEGITKVYPVNTDEAWEITIAVFRWEKTDEVEEHRDRNYVITSTGMKMATFGSVMGVWIEPVDADHTEITVITRRRVQSDTFTELTGPKFFKRFEQGMRIVKSGRKLPLTPPETSMSMDPAASPNPPISQ
jgi:hypothetical protein